MPIQFRNARHRITHGCEEFRVKRALRDHLGLLRQVGQPLKMLLDRCRIGRRRFLKGCQIEHVQMPELPGQGRALIRCTHDILAGYERGNGCVERFVGCARLIDLPLNVLSQIIHRRGQEIRK